MNKINKLLLIIKSFFLQFLFKECSYTNIFEDRSIQIGRKSISIGKNNRFKSYAKISVDYDLTNQFLNIGNNNIFESFCVIRSQGGYIKIGNNNFLGERIQIQGKGGVEIGNNCMIAANTFISSSNHDFSDPSSDNYLKKEIDKKTIIGNNVWIGTNCSILAGTNIGNFCIIGAGTVVTKDIPDYHIAVGNPCKLIKKYDLDNNQWNKINVNK